MSDVKIYSGTSQIRVMEIKNILESENIEFYEINKLDSSYTGILGEINLFVDAVNAEKAKRLVESAENE